MTNYRWLNDKSLRFLHKDDGYLAAGQSVDQRVDVICNRAEQILKKPGFAARFKENFAKGWYSFSTPVWTNFGTDRGLPISCFGSCIEDSMKNILYTQAEVGMMTKHGGGTSAYFGNLRERGAPIRNNGESSGPVHFMQLFESTMKTVSQGSARRGSFAAYLPVDHPDVGEFLKLHTEGDPIQLISWGVTISDDWMHTMLAGDRHKREVWCRIVESRYGKSGYPYLLFSDNVNKTLPQVYKDHGRRVLASNLCTEIMLPSTADESFVCDLGSMNVLYFDEWKDTDAVELYIYFLDVVMTEFIEKARHIEFLERAVRFAERHRALGLGWFGWHHYLQSKMVAFESLEAKMLNAKVAKTIWDSAEKATRQLAVEYGEPELLKGYGRRNATLCAIAPTKSSSYIIGQASEGIEPDTANYVVKQNAKATEGLRNPYLEKLLEEKGHNSPQVWDVILKDAGSVRKLGCLDEHEKAVFRTFMEISPMEIVTQAAQRQKWIDQGQSLNLMIHASEPPKKVSQVMIEAWRLGVKSLYYQKNVNQAQEFSRDLLSCSSCEG